MLPFISKIFNICYQIWYPETTANTLAWGGGGNVRGGGGWKGMGWGSGLRCVWGEGAGLTSYICFSKDVHAKWPPFYMISHPFFKKKCMSDLIFLDSYVKGPTFLTSRYICVYFSIRDF